MRYNNQKIVTVGTFDGVHLGHQKILKKVVDLSKKNQLVPAILTFFPHPRMVLDTNHSIKLLSTVDERIELLKTHGIEATIVKPFTKEFASLSAEAYIKQILIDELNIKHLVIGYDHRFGKNRTAGFKEVIQFSERYGFTVNEISAKDIDNVTISSTKIRNALNNGKVSLANTYLGYNYYLTGNVIKGKSIGRTIGFPTANISIKETYKLIPKDGVFVVSSIIDNHLYYGMMNIGTNPTFKQKQGSIEVHFFDFEANIYEKKLKVSILKRLRDEKKFESIEALKKQLLRDKQHALEYIAQFL